MAVADSNVGDAVVESGVNPGNTPFAGDASATGNVLTNDTDVDTGAGKTVTTVGTFAGTYGSLSLAANGSWTYTLDNGDGDTNALAQGAPASEVFNYTMTDEFGATSSSALTINLTGTNDAPVGVNDSGSATEKGGTNNASGGSNATGNVLANDTDVDNGFTHVVSAIRSGGTEGAGAAGTVGSGLIGSHGTLTLNANGSYTYVVNEADSAVQALNSSQALTDSFNYTAADDHGAADVAVLTVTINGANDAPVLDLNGATAGNNATAIFTEQTPVVIAPAATVTDVDSANLSSLTATLTARPDGNATESLALNASAASAASGAGLTVSYTASTGVLAISGSTSKATYQSILDGIQYKNTSDAPTTTNRIVNIAASDGTDTGATQSVTISVTAVNDGPVISGLTITGTTISFVATDPDNATLALSAPFAAAFSNPVITSGATTNLTATQQGSAVSGTLQVTDGTATANVVGLYLGTSSANTGVTAPLATSPNAMYGFGGNDSMTGGSADDILVGGNGTDTLSGGAGNDTYVFNAGDGFDTINDSAGTSDTLVLQTGGLALSALNFSDSITTSGVGNMFISVGSDQVTVNNQFVAGNGVEFVSFGGASFGGYSLGTGSYAISTDDSSPQDGTSGNDVIIGDAQGDAINGAGGNDLLFGNDQVDTLTGGTGSDLLAGGAGSDVYEFGLSDGVDTVVDSAGTDAIQIQAGGSALSSLNFLNDGSNNLVISYNGQQVTVSGHYSGGAVESITFTGGGTYAGHSLGTNSYALSTDNLTPLDGGGGNTQDVIASTNGTQTLNGGNGNDLLFGNGGGDTINGEQGSDLIAGGAGNDILTGGTTGGSNDTFVFNTALDADNNVDQIQDFQAGGEDAIALSSVIFTGIGTSGTLNSANFYSGGVGTAAADVGNAGTAKIVYDTSTGSLYYDADGGTSANRTLFADITINGAGTFNQDDIRVGP